MQTHESKFKSAKEFRLCQVNRISTIFLLCFPALIALARLSEWKKAASLKKPADFGRVVSRFENNFITDWHGMLSDVLFWPWA